jgi:hypothetical protein
MPLRHGETKEEVSKAKVVFKLELPLVLSCGDLSQRKVDYWRTNEVKNLKKIANPQAFTEE